MLTISLYFIRKKLTNYNLINVIFLRLLITKKYMNEALYYDNWMINVLKKSFIKIIWNYSHHVQII